MRAASAGFGVIVLSTVLLGGDASAQTASDEITMYAGPGDRFPVVATVARDSTLDVRGCVEGYRWCDVAWQNNRGWVMAERVTYPFQDREASIRDLGDRLGIPVVGFSFGTYWDDFYSGQPWYGERERWQSMWRDQPDYLQFGRSARVNQTAGREFDSQRELNLTPGQDNRNGIADRLDDRPGATDSGPGGQQGSGMASEADRSGPDGTAGTSGIQPGSPDATGSLGQGRTGGQSGVSGGTGRGAGSSSTSGSGSSSSGSASTGSSSGGGSSGGGGSGGGGGGGGGG